MAQPSGVSLSSSVVIGGSLVLGVSASRHAGHVAAVRHRRVQRVGLPPSMVKHLRAAGVLASVHHARTGRVSHALLEVGLVFDYDAVAKTARVQLVGSASRVLGAVAVSLAVPTVGIAGKQCLVSLLDAHNPADGVLVATW